MFPCWSGQIPESSRLRGGWAELSQDHWGILSLHHSLSHTQKQAKSLPCLTNCLNHRFPCLGEGLIKLWSVQVSVRPTFEVNAEVGAIFSAGGAEIESEQEILGRCRVPMQELKYSFNLKSVHFMLTFFLVRESLCQWGKYLGNIVWYEANG